MRSSLSLHEQRRKPVGVERERPLTGTIGSVTCMSSQTFWWSRSEEVATVCGVVAPEIKAMYWLLPVHATLLPARHPDDHPMMYGCPAQPGAA